MPIAKGAKLTLEQLAKIIIRNSMIFQKNKVLTAMLYNQEVILA